MGQTIILRQTHTLFPVIPNIEVDRRKSIELTQNVHNGIGCFEDTFLLQLKPDSKPYQAPLRHVVYALEEPFKDELDWLQKLYIITQLGVDETAEWCNSLCVSTQSNGKVRLCLDPVRLK